jgi:hypothetical protein
MLEMQMQVGQHFLHLDEQIRMQLVLLLSNDIQQEL